MKLQIMIHTFRGYGVILGAQGPPKRSGRAMSFRAMLAETHRSMIFKAQQKSTKNNIDKRIEATIKDICIFEDIWSF